MFSVFTLCVSSLFFSGPTSLPENMLGGKCRRDAFAQDIDVHISIRSGTNFNFVNKDIADKLALDAESSSLPSNAVIGDVVKFKLTIFIDVKKGSGPVIIAVFFAVSAGFPGGIILGDRAIAKARLIESPIPEIQEKLDQLAALSTAEVHQGISGQIGSSEMFC